jgi:hypothetical protein
MMSSGDPEKTPLGEKIIVAGLFFQILLFGFFVVVAWNFHKKINREPTAASLELADRPSRQNWRMLLLALYISSALILVRSLFRAIEFIDGNDGYLMRNEAWLYGFDSLLMWIAVVVFNFWHPSGAVPGDVKKTMGWATNESEDNIELGRSGKDSRRTTASSV